MGRLGGTEEYYNMQKERARLAGEHQPEEAKKALDRSDLLFRMAE